MLAEDDPDIRGLVARALRAEGYGVLEFEDGTALADGIASALLFGSLTGGLDGVDLLISDVRMPGRTGLDVLLWLRQSGIAVSVILMTAFPDPATRAEAARLRATRLLPKPFQLDVLLEEVRALSPSTAQRDAPSSWRAY
jgi:DNA-binding response OmpR family regulator